MNKRNSNIEKFKTINNELQNADIKQKTSMMNKVPKKIRIIMYVKMCSDEQLDSLITSWKDLKDDDMLKRIYKRIRKVNRDYWHEILNDYT